jgi:protein-tyrosine phosphatase
VRGFVDLHCHWIAGIDDGARKPEEGIAMLRELYRIGFDRVVATPHMRPNLFDNHQQHLRRAFDAMLPHLAGLQGLPRVELSSEHYFDDVVFHRLLSGEGLPYPGGHAVLLEFYEIDFPPMIERRLFELSTRKQLLPVIAHPERYHCIWRSADILERLVDAGVGALLDTAALVGKYGRKPKRSAEELLERGLYHAACSDAHRPADVAEVEAGMRRIDQLYGDDEVEFLFKIGPQALLEGRLPE